MILYADTSALVKKYIAEDGTQETQDLLHECDYVVTSAFTELEMLSTVEISKKLRRIASPSYRNILGAIEKDFQEGSLVIINITESILKTSKRLIQQRHLRAPDALQLSSALQTKKRLGTNVEFLCADHTLIEAARLEGLSCIMPQSGK